jgi:RNA polymerase sigma factor (sigma-70 family)
VGPQLASNPFSTFDVGFFHRRQFTCDMQNRTDAELLRDYAANKSEAAFGEIVRRYADAIYSAASRQVGNEEQARDVAQTVFVDLARKAASLNANTLLIGWLHRGTRLAALEQLRADQRRQIRERKAMEFFDPSPDAPNDWNAVRPVLDEAIANLGNEDRDALLLRFFKNENLASIGATLGVSEDAAQKRVSRALGKLREFLEQRGIKTTAAALSAALAANVVQSAPTGFAATLVAGSLAKASVAGSSATPIAKLFTVSNMKTVALIVTLAGSLVALSFIKIKSQNQLQKEQMLAQQQAEEIERLRVANDDLANRTNEIARLRSDALETLRLRGEVTRLRRDLADQKALAGAKTKPEMTSQPDRVESQQITISTKFLSVPEGVFSASANGMLTELQTRTLLHFVEKNDGAISIGDGSVTMLNKRQAQLQIAGDRSQTNAPTFIVDVMPSWATNSRNINLEFSISAETMVDLRPDELPPNASTRVRDVRSLQATNSVSVRDGETLLLSRKISSNELYLLGNSAVTNSEPRTLLILLTPTLIDRVGNRLFVNDEDASGEESTNVFPGVRSQR